MITIARRMLVRCVVAASLAVSALGAAQTIWIAPAHAAKDGEELDRLRSAGLLMERFDGYLVAAPNASGSAKALAEKINGQRRAIYEKRAQENGVPVLEVGKIYAAQILESAPSGTVFVGENGQMQTKP